MKKPAVFLAAVFATGILFLSACSARNPASAASFQKTAASLGYKVTQAADTSYGSDTKSLIAAKSGSDTQIAFTVFADASTAEDQFSSLKQDLTATGGKSAVDADAYNKYTAQNGELYYTLVRIDNTMLSCKGTVAKKGEIEDFIKAIKYD